jgi:hypothetical protein
MLSRNREVMSSIEIEFQSSDTKWFMTYLTKYRPVENIIGDTIYRIGEARGWDGFFDLWEW